MCPISSIPPSSGVDWSKQDFKVISPTHNNATLTTALTVTGGGYLLGLNQMSSNATYLKITVDGNVICPEIQYGLIGAGVRGGGSLVWPELRYNTSLLVEHHAEGFTTMQTNIAYTEDL